jgi:VRR-NUC domain-containing protein
MSRLGTSSRSETSHSRATSEQAVQRAVCLHLRQRGARGLLWFHVPNGGHRKPVEAAIFNGLGVRAGVSDLILLRDGRAFALELKTERGRPTAAQTQFISEFRAAGGEASVVNGLNQALHTLETWKLLRGHAA